MRYLFSPAGTAALEAVLARTPLLAFDFDGTLAPIVRSPERAYAPMVWRNRLRKLHSYYWTAVISGRGVSDVRSRLGFPVDHIVGNHGMEGLESFKDRIGIARATCTKWYKQLELDPAPWQKDRGVMIENKRYSLSLHYQRSKKPLEAERNLRASIRMLDPAPRVVLGHSVFNLVPQGFPHKGNALLEVMRQHGCHDAIYIGDDVTDEDVFRLRQHSVFTIRVGQRATSAADYYVRDQHEVGHLLSMMLAAAPSHAPVAGAEALGSRAAGAGRRRPARRR